MGKVLLESTKEAGRTRLVRDKEAAVMVQSGRWRYLAAPRTIAASRGSYRRRDMRAEG